MTAYSAVHLMLAMMCVVLAALHLGIGALTHGRPELHWLGAAFGGFALVLVMDGVAGEGAGGALGSSQAWLWLVLICLWLYWVMLRTAWAVAGVPYRGWRRALGTVAAVLIGLRVGELGWTLVTSTNPLTLESLIHRERVGAMVMQVVSVTVGVVWIYEGLRGSRPRTSRFAMAGAAAVALALIGHDLLSDIGYWNRPALIGLAGLPFLLFSSADLGIHYAMAAREIEQGELGRYRVIRRLAKGGMGEVFLATRTGPEGFQREVVLKRMIPGTAAEQIAVERFLSEARTAAQLHHPNIVAVYDLGKHRDGYFLVMEYLRGLSLADIRDALRERMDTIPGEVVATIGEQVCRALAYAHERSVIHRDISPHNIMITVEGTVKLVDFGIAKTAGSVDFTEPSSPPAKLPVGALAAPSPVPSPDLTTPGHVIGKVAYLSPERLEGVEATTASDLYALGVVLYELCAGERPFTNAADTRRAAPMPVRVLAPHIPWALSVAIERALSPHPGSRFATAIEMGQELKASAPGEVDLALWLRTSFAQQLESNAERAILGEQTKLI